MLKRKSSLRNNPQRLNREAPVLKKAKVAAILRDAQTVYRAPDGTVTAVGRKCIACLTGMPFRDGTLSTDWGRTDYNHCIPRSRLQGEHNWPVLHSPENLAPTCRRHHDEHDAMPEYWLPIMAKVFGYSYTTEPFSKYMKENHE